MSLHGTRRRKGNVVPCPQLAGRRWPDLLRCVLIDRQFKGLSAMLAEAQFSIRGVLGCGPWSEGQKLMRRREPQRAPPEVGDVVSKNREFKHQNGEFEYFDLTGSYLGS
jgi:hypothetical protein